LHHLSYSRSNKHFTADYKGLSRFFGLSLPWQPSAILLPPGKSKRTIQPKEIEFCESYPPSPVIGPTLVYKRAKSGAASFSALAVAWILPPLTRCKPFRISPTINMDALPGQGHIVNSAAS
jgi:hypothetical protein